VGMWIPVGIPMGIPVGMAWVWGLKCHPHGSPVIRGPQVPNKWHLTASNGLAFSRVNERERQSDDAEVILIASNNSHRLMNEIK